MTQAALPSRVQRDQQGRFLYICYGADRQQLSAEFLRVLSPSAQVRQHGHPILVYGKANVLVLAIELIGRYGIKITFSDGHDSGIYSWAYLAELIKTHDQRWADYCQALQRAGQSRDANVQVVQIQPPQQ